MPAAAQLGDGKAAAALREPLAARIAHKRHMAEGRARPPKSLGKEDLPGSAREEIGAADHLLDPHRLVVGDDGQLVGGQIVAPPDHEVAEVDAGRALDQAGGRVA